MLGILYKILKEQRKQTKILQSIESRLKDNDNRSNNMNTTEDVSSRESKSYFLFTAKTKKHQTFSNDFTKNQIQRVRMASKLKDTYVKPKEITHYGNHRGPLLPYNEKEYSI